MNVLSVRCQVSGLRVFLAISIVILFGWTCWIFLAIHDAWSRDCLVYAAQSGDVRLIQCIVAAGADPSKVGWEEHETPLGAAAHCGRGDVVRLLVRLGANVNERDDHSQTAAAIAHGCREIAIEQYLKRSGGHY